MKDTTLKARQSNRDRILYEIMKAGEWFTLEQINSLSGYPTASASAGIRDFRKPMYGSNTVEKNYLGNGVYQYRLVKNPNNNIIEEKLGTVNETL
jgi:hypothetical protein